MQKSTDFSLFGAISLGILCCLLVPTVLVALTTGCGKTRHLSPVSGKVSYKGAPLQFGTVMFQAESGQPSTGKIQPDGTFAMETRGEGDGAPIGKNQVRVLCFEGQSPSRQNVSNRGEGTLGNPLIPQKYLSYSTSGITIDVSPGENEPFNIELTDR